MSAGIDRRSLVPLVLGIAFVLLAALFAAPADAVGATPTIRLLISAKNVTVERSGRGFVSVDPGAYVTPVGEDFENSTIEFKAGRELIPGIPLPR